MKRLNRTEGGEEQRNYEACSHRSKRNDRNTIPNLIAIPVSARSSRKLKWSLRGGVLSVQRSARKFWRERNLAKSQVEIWTGGRLFTVHKSQWPVSDSNPFMKPLRNKKKLCEELVLEKAMMFLHHSHDTRIKLKLRQNSLESSREHATSTPEPPTSRRDSITSLTNSPLIGSKHNSRTRDCLCKQL